MTELQPLTLPTAEDAEEWVRVHAEEGLAAVRKLVAGLKAEPPADALAAVRTYDEAVLNLGNVAAMGSLISNVHPTVAVRDAAEKAEQEARRLGTELSLDRDLYEVFAGLDGTGLDPLPGRLLDKLLRDFRRAGVDQDAGTRERITAIQQRITEVEQQFSRNIREGTKSIKVEPERLTGLPADWLEAHPADDDGLITVSTDYPDSLPTRMYAADHDVRSEITTAFLTVGWPDNEPLLTELFDLRHELANLVGYDDWASYDADVKMIKRGRAIPEFIDRIAEVAEERMHRDLEVLLARFRADVPGASSITTADSLYYTETVRKEQFEVDSQEVRTYFDFPKVRQGLLDVTGRLFGLRYEQVPDAVLWHDDVTAYDVYPVVEPLETAGGVSTSSTPEGGSTTEGGSTNRLGRIYLDLHPRDGKYNHAAQFSLADGVAGRQLAEGVLVCNFSKSLMEHDHVVTLFHEFGHLVHHVLGGQGEWARFSGVATEWDFVEAPSQMLEEWAWDADILRSFATNADDEPIPADLVRRMRAGDEFGKGIWCRTQMFYAALSYWFHTERPADLTARTRELQEQYAPFPYIEGTHFFASFGHLGGYSSAYYTYMWSLVIAKDLFSAFDPEHLFAPEVAGRYRDRVLAPGGSKDAADLVEDFLGRPYRFDAFAEWLAR